MSSIYSEEELYAQRQRQREDDRRRRQDDDDHWQRVAAEQQAHRSSSSSAPIDGAVLFAPLIYLLKLILEVLMWPIGVAIGYGYGKHLLFLFFVAPIVLFVGACVVALVMGIHAHPQVFLGDWQTYVAQHPEATHWTWLARDLTQWIHAA
ncbi:hypothetical protein ACJU26_03920 [Acidithiobacillus sp. M4-SHS-6]|uniref:hypothetical protein n=1 Tax=Acidithiobacillus sp. M4-SHS-6 TaxID=3383024 RepID=UPI0039BE5462